MSSRRAIPARYNELHTVLRRALADAVEWGYVAGNVAAGKRVKPPKLDGSSHMSVWAAAQLQLFLAGTSEERLSPLCAFWP